MRWKTYVILVWSEQNGPSCTTPVQLPPSSTTLWYVWGTTLGCNGRSPRVSKSLPGACVVPRGLIAHAQLCSQRRQRLHVLRVSPRLNSCAHMRHGRRRKKKARGITNNDEHHIPCQGPHRPTSREPHSANVMQGPRMASKSRPNQLGQAPTARTTRRVTVTPIAYQSDHAVTFASKPGGWKPSVQKLASMHSPACTLRQSNTTHGKTQTRHTRDIHACAITYTQGMYTKQHRPTKDGFEAGQRLDKGT